MKSFAKISLASAALAGSVSADAPKKTMLGRRAAREAAAAKVEAEAEKEQEIYDSEPLPDRKDGGESIGMPHMEGATANAHLQKKNMEVESEDIAPEQYQEGAVETAPQESSADKEAKAKFEEQRKKYEEEMKERQRVDKIERAPANQKYKCPLTRRFMKNPVRAYGPVDTDPVTGEAMKDEDGEPLPRDFHHFEGEWIRRWVKEKGTDPLNPEHKLTEEDLEEDEDMKREIEKWAKKKRYTWTVPSATPKEDTEFQTLKDELTKQAGNDREATTPILEHQNVKIVEYNGVEDAAPVELGSKIDASFVKDLVEYAQWPQMMDRENEDLKNPDDDKNGEDYEIADIKSWCHKIPRFEDMSSNVQEIVHVDHKGSGKTQRALVGYVQDESHVFVSMMGHTSAHEWEYVMKKVEENGFTMKGDTKDKDGKLVAGNMDTPVVGAEEQNTNGRFHDVVVHSHYWQEWKHLKFNGEYTARGGKEDAGGMRHHIIELWKAHRKYHMNGGNAMAPLRITATGHGSGGAMANFMVLDLALDNEKLPFMEKYTEAINPWKCTDFKCLVDNGQIEFSTVTFGAPRVMNALAAKYVEDATFDKRRQQSRAVRVEMVFDPIPQTAGPKDTMAEEHAKLFLPVGKPFYLAPSFEEGKALPHGKAFLDLLKNKENAVYEIEAMHSLANYSLAIKGGTEGKKDFLFSMRNGEEAPFHAMTKTVATEQAETFYTWITKHIYNPVNPFKQMFGKNGGGAHKDMGNMFNNILGGGKGGNGGNFLNEMMSKMGGQGGGQGGLHNLLNGLGGGQGGQGGLHNLLNGLGGGHGQDL